MDFERTTASYSGGYVSRSIRIVGMIPECYHVFTNKRALKHKVIYQRIISELTINEIDRIFIAFLMA